jgi:hypothetical protein
MKAAVVTQDHQVNVTEKRFVHCNMAKPFKNGLLRRMPHRPAR